MTDYALLRQVTELALRVMRSAPETLQVLEEAAEVARVCRALDAGADVRHALRANGFEHIAELLDWADRRAVA